MEDKQERYTKIICDYLESHKLVSTNGLEEALEIPGAIAQAKGGHRLIPEKHIYSILCKLADYGLTIDGYRLTYDPMDDSLSATMFVENIKTKEKKAKGGSHFEYIVKEYRWLATDYFDLP